MTTSMIGARRAPLRQRFAALALVGCLGLSACSSGTATESASGSTTTSQAAGSITATTDATTTAETISQTDEAAKAFLGTLDAEQREQVLYAFDDETKTTSWSNFPVTFVERTGVDLADLTNEQRTAAMEVLEGLLSDEGYETVAAIIGGDQYLADNSSSTEDSLGHYYIAFFGDPSTTSGWEVQFGGHHLGINATLDGEADSITFAPTHLGVQPAAYTDEDGVEVQPFDGIYTDAFAFYDSLTDEQRSALGSGEVSMCAPGDTCAFETGSGLRGSDLSDEQRRLLLEVVANWAGLADEETTTSTLAKIEETLQDTYVAWSGETTYDMTGGNGIDFSISGPDVYVAFQAQDGSAGADVDGVTTSGWGHVHTVYRDPSNDYAGSATQQAGSGTGGGPDGAGGPPDGAPSDEG